jgi:hypothetical protein
MDTTSTEKKHTARCPVCEHITTVRVVDVPIEEVNIVSKWQEEYGIDHPKGSYFCCQNPRCWVERIYSSSAVMVGGPR